MQFASVAAWAAASGELLRPKELGAAAEMAGK